MASFGNKSGPVYPLGLFTVTTAGTVIPLNTNIPVTDAFGTAANPSPLKCTTVKVMNTHASVALFLVFAASAATANNGLGVILHVPAGQERSLESNAGSNQFSVDDYALDASGNGGTGYVTLVIA